MAAWNASALCFKFRLPTVWLLPASVTDLWVLSLSSNSRLVAGEAFTYLKLQPSAETWATQVTDWCKDGVDSGRRQMHVLKNVFLALWPCPAPLFVACRHVEGSSEGAGQTWSSPELRERCGCAAQWGSLSSSSPRSPGSVTSHCRTEMGAETVARAGQGPRTALREGLAACKSFCFLLKLPVMISLNLELK